VLKGARAVAAEGKTTHVPVSALLLALAAACVHALWNLLLARASDVEARTAVALLVALLAFAPVAALTWEWDAAVWPYIATTSALQLSYFLLLTAAYRGHEFSVVYPVARGSAPVLVLVVGVLFLGTSTSAGQTAAVGIVALGILLVRGLSQRAAPGAVLFGLAIAACIAGYTLIDKDGIRYAGPIPYNEVAMTAPTLVYAASVVARKGLAALRAELNGTSVVAGLATFGAYALVLAALERGPAAPVAAVRETSIVIATGLAALFLRERVGPMRLLGAVVVAGGVALLTLS
jgi:drug/metabolite transporter (DMT)-like permease